MTMYYKLRNAITRKQVGYQFQTTGFIDGYDIHGPNSRIRLEWDKFPDFVPDLRFELHKKSKLTDVVTASNISATGFLINEKVKEIFDECLLPEHRYYEATLLNHDGNVLPYYWLHLISNDYKMIDFESSIFRKTKDLMKFNSIKEDPIYPIKDLKDFKDTNSSIFENNFFIVFDVLKIHNTQKYDMLHFGDIDVNSVFISEKLATLLKKAKITGIDIIEYPDVQDME